MAFQVSSMRIAAMAAALLFEILFPLAVAMVVRRRLGVSWRYFGYGALIFFVFQLISRVPLVTAAPMLLGPELTNSIGWLVILCLTAGLFEEIGRYIGFRWLMKHDEKTWEQAVMYGLGHGGLESMLLVGGLVLIGLINLLAYSIIPPETLPPEQRKLIAEQLAALNAQPAWLPLLGAWERLWTLPVHVALSVTVLQVFRRGSIVWLWIAVLAHTLVNLISIGTPRFAQLSGMSALLTTEALITVFGALGLWWIMSRR